MSDNDLSSAFGQSAAARGREGLARILPQRQERQTPAEPGKPPESAPGAATRDSGGPPSAGEGHDRGADATAPPTVAEPAERAPVPTPREPDLTSPISVYVLPAALKVARRRRASQRRAHADIALAAIEANRARLGELVADRSRVEVRPAGSLFPARTARRAPGATPRRVLWTLFLTAAEIEVVDMLMRESGAASRSELISVAVEAELLERRRGQAQPER